MRLLPDHPDVTALLIGRAGRSHQAFLDGLKSQIAAAGLSDRILFPGEIAPDALPALMRGLSAVVQLPRYEGYGMAPLEGMASGVPFVATDQGYYRSFSGQGSAGVIVPEDDAEATTPTLACRSADMIRGITRKWPEPPARPPRPISASSPKPMALTRSINSSGDEG